MVTKEAMATRTSGANSAVAELSFISKEHRPPLSLLTQLLTEGHRIATWLQSLAASLQDKQVKNLCLVEGYPHMHIKFTKDG